MVASEIHGLCEEADSLLCRGYQLQELYKVISGAITRAILDYNDTKAEFLKHNQLPEHASIPDLLDFDGQPLRSTMERV